MSGSPATSPTVISLTSIPPRFDTLGPVLESLLSQGADAVALCIPRTYRRFGTADPPRLPAGITLIRSDTDFGPATKLLPALARWPEARIAYCDDDCLYGPGWLDALTAAATQRTAVAASGWPVARLRRQGAAPPFTDIAQGFGGVLVSAQMFDPRVFDTPEPCWPVDDIWLSAHLAINGVPLRQASQARRRVTPIAAPDQLQSTRIGGSSRADWNSRAAEWINRAYGIWPPAAPAPSGNVG